MKTIFDPVTRQDLISRVNNLDEKSHALWGKMDVVQMARHCSIWDEWVQGKNAPVYKQELLGKIFGKMALKSNTRDDKPIGKNMPAGKFAVKDKGGNLQEQKAIWTDLIQDYGRYSNDGFIHDFFGKMTREQIGIFAYKHADHHLRQFGV